MELIPAMHQSFTGLVSLITSMATIKAFMFCIVIFAAIFVPTTAQLTPDFYNKICPAALPAIRNVVKKAISREPRMGASLLRLHFHDCFVNGCDGSILLDDVGNFVGEKTAAPNLNSVRGFEVVDEIREAVNKVCRRNVVSCADILAVAARDSVFLLGGPYYAVLLGRRDARTASLRAANSNLAPPFFSLSQLLSFFQAKGFNLKDLVALSGGHTLGLARCVTFRDRIYNDSNIDPAFATYLRKTCPRAGGDGNIQPLDATPYKFDTTYFSNLMARKGKGLLHSDQELFKHDGSANDQLVKLYASSPRQFAEDFSSSMIKLGNLSPLTGYDGEIRLNCRRVNY